MRKEGSTELEGSWVGGELLSAMARARKYEEGGAAGGFQQVPSAEPGSGEEDENRREGRGDPI